MSVRSRATARTAARMLAAVLAVVSAGCAGAASDEPPASDAPVATAGAATVAVVTPADALGAPDGVTVAVRGYVVSSGGVTVVAEMLAESYPPQPGGAQLPVEGLDVETLEGTSTAGDVTWTDDPRIVAGVIENGVLRVP